MLSCIKILLELPKNDFRGILMREKTRFYMKYIRKMRSYEQFCPLTIKVNT